MSGPPKPDASSSSLSTDDALVVANARRLSTVPAGAGPDDAHILAAIRGFVDRFDFWYVPAKKPKKIPTGKG